MVYMNKNMAVIYKQKYDDSHQLSAGTYCDVCIKYDEKQYTIYYGTEEKPPRLPGVHFTNMD